MQSKVPQNVDIEDKVIGNLTLRQFMIILVAIGLDMVLYFLIPSFLRPIFWISALIVTGLAIVVAFVKYGDQNLEIFLLSAYKTFQSPRMRVWRKEFHPHEHKEEVVSGVKAQQAHKKSVEEVRGNLQKLAEVVDSGGGINFNSGERMIAGVGEQAPTNDETPDLLARTEGAQPILEQIFKKTTPAKREPTISEVASVSPQKKFTWPTIKRR